MFWIGFLIVIGGLYIFFHSHHQVESDNFYGEVPFLFSIGIYYWGQGLIIAPFWMMVGLVTMFWLRPLDLVKLYLLFHLFRSFYEILFWMKTEHKKLKSPPLLGQLTHFSHGEETMLYQISHLMVVITFGYLLLILP